MLTTFDIPVKGSIEDLYRTKQQLYDFLNTLITNKIPENDFMLNELRETMKDLMKRQRTDLKHPRNLSWCLPEDDSGMCSEARVDFMYEPTYIVVSIMTYVKVHYPDVVESIGGYDGVLKKGMRFSTMRNLSGHGYESLDGTAEAVRIFDLGGVPAFLEENKFFCFDLYRLLKNIYRNIVHNLARGTTIAGWNKDYKKEMEAIADKLSVFKI